MSIKMKAPRANFHTGSEILIENVRRYKSSAIMLILAIISQDALVASAQSRQEDAIHTYQMIPERSLESAKINLTDSPPTGTRNLTRMFLMFPRPSKSSRSPQDSNEIVNTVSVNITSLDTEQSLTVSNKSKSHNDSDTGDQSKAVVSSLLLSSSTTSTSTTTTTTRRPTLSARSRWFLNQIRKRRKLKALSEHLTGDTETVERGNFSVSASQNHEDWVNFSPTQAEKQSDDAKTASSMHVSKRVASLIQKKEMSERGEDDEEQEVGESSSISHEDKPLVSKSTTTTTTIGDGKKQAKLISKSGASLPPGLKRKIIEQFVKAGGNPNNIVVSDSTITTTSQSKKKTVTTVYKLEPTADGGTKTSDKPLMRAIKITQNPNISAKSISTLSSPKMAQVSGGKSMTELLGNPKRDRGAKKVAPKVKRIMVTRTEVPAVLTASLAKDQKEPELGEFYQGPHETIFGLNDKHSHFSSDQKKAILNLDKMIDHGPMKQMKVVEPSMKDLKPSKMIKVSKMKSPMLLEDRPKGIGGGGISLETLSDMMNVKIPPTKHLTNFKDIKSGKDMPTKKASEQEVATRTNSTLTMKASQTKRGNPVEKESGQVKSEELKKQQGGKEAKGEGSLTELRRSVLSVSSKRLPSGTKTTNQLSVATPAPRQPKPVAPPQPKPSKSQEKLSTPKPAKPQEQSTPKAAPVTTSRPSATSTAPTTTSTSTTSTTSTTAQPNLVHLGKPRTHNIMMLIDFDANEAKDNDEPRLEKAASWVADGNRWQPVDQRQPQTRGKLMRASSSAAQHASPSLDQMPAVNVQIYNSPQVSPMGEFSLDELSSSSLIEQPSIQQLVTEGDGQAATGYPNYLKTSELGFVQPGRASGVPDGFASLASAAEPQIQQHQGGEHEHQLGSVMAPTVQMTPVANNQLDELILPGESASTNQLVRQVINQLAMSREPLKVSASELQAVRPDEPAYYTTTSVQDETGDVESEAEDGEILGNDEPALLSGTATRADEPSSDE